MNTGFYAISKGLKKIFFLKRQEKQEGKAFEDYFVDAEMRERGLL